MMVEIVNITDEEDGGAIISFDLTNEELKRFAEIGILAALMDAAMEVITDKPYLIFEVISGEKKFIAETENYEDARKIAKKLYSTFHKDSKLVIVKIIDEITSPVSGSSE